MERKEDSPEIKGVASHIECDRYTDDSRQRTEVHVPMETELTIYVNLKELVTILCTPTKLNFLVLGFLYGEGIISGLKDVLSMRVCEDELMADVRLTKPDYEPPGLRVLTSGCGGGSSFTQKGKKVISDVTVTPKQIYSLMRELQEKMDMYRFCGGVHTSALGDKNGLIVVAEDIGRHNTIDKIQGESLMMSIPTKDRLLLSTGRVSSEMLLKASRMEVPIVVSRHSSTARAIEFAKELGITLIGYARGNRLMVYSHPERVSLSGDG
ncbi:MAG: formate dehydrogenase accessory sulfurtransferase FdhD [Syntrophorhabdaceae bacterium]|nr:formate dehydrogenase accessory sulfurtransferase FdhD [Syntrophorhabdaceae bacterium]